MIAVTRSRDTFTWWWDETHEHTPLCRIGFSKPGPRLGAGISSSDENGWMTFQASCWWKVWLTLPWLPVPAFMRGRETRAEIDWNTDARLPSLYLWLGINDEPWNHKLGFFRLIDLLQVVLGRWDSKKEVISEMSDRKLVLTIDGQVCMWDVVVEVRRFTCAWSRQFWPAVVQYGGKIELADSNVEGWPDARPHRRAKGSISASSLPLPGLVSANEALDLFRDQWHAEAKP